MLPVSGVSVIYERYSYPTLSVSTFTTGLGHVVPICALLSHEERPMLLPFHLVL